MKPEKLANMSSGPSTFRETNVKRAIRGARAAGVEIGRVEIDKRGVIVPVRKPVAPEAA